MKGKFIATLLLSSVLVSACLPIFKLQAALTPQNVLVVVNTNSADSVAIGNYYLSVHPGAQVVNIGTTTSDSIVRSSFISEIRDPIRNYLSSTAGLSTQIVSIVTTRGVPYQLTDSVGQGGNYTSFSQGLTGDASVDSELTLLWQNMVAGNSFSNAFPAHDVIFNPYFGAQTAINSFNRGNIQTNKNWTGVVDNGVSLFFESPSHPFTGNNAWGFSTKGSEPVANQLNEGDFYLVTRLSGYSVTDVTNSIARSLNIQVNKTTDTIVLDGTPSGFDYPAYHLFGTNIIYDHASNILGNAGFTIAYSREDAAITNLPNGQRVLSYSSSGTHSPPSTPLSNNPQYINDVLQFNYAPGAIFNTYESFNGSDFNNPAHGNQGMVADFIRQGGTLGFGHVFEPFTIAVAYEDFYLPDLLTNGLTWAEAAYGSIPFLSWENVIIGDPLATFSFIPEPSAALNCIGLVFLARVILRHRRDN